MKMTNNPAGDILREAGIGTDQNNLKQILDTNFLTLNHVVEELSNLVHGSSKEETKLRSIESALKLHKVMDEDKSVPSITIVIQPPVGMTAVEGVPSILIPRDIEKKTLLN